MRFLRRPLLVLGAACTLVVSLSGQTVRVLSVSGEATVQLPGESAPRAVRKGDTIVVGTRIVTGEGARVILTPLPGVNSIISPKSEVVIESVSSPAPGATPALHSAVLDLKSGAVTTDLKSTPGVELDYGVRTARGLAGARGTTYTVGINAAGIQTIVVADGVITLTLADGRVVSLVPGQVSITQTDGSTQAVTKASDLSAGDQAIAENWVETTIAALLEAIEQGIDIDPAALEDAVRAARELGIEIDAATQARIDRARDTLAERRLALLEFQTGDNNSSNSDAEIITETRGPDTHLDDDAYLQARAAYLASLTESRRAAFLALSDELQRLLVNANDSAYTAYALDLYNAGQSRPHAAIRYAGRLTASLRTVFIDRPEDVQDFLAARPSDSALRDFALVAGGRETLPDRFLLAFFEPLSAGQRTAYRALSPSLQYALAEAANPALTAYALATGRDPAVVAYAVSLDASTRLPLFLGYPSALQALLAANSGDSALADFAYATNESGGNLHSHAAITYFAGLGAEDRGTYASRPPALQDLAVNDAAFAGLLLARDPQTQAPLYSDSSLQHYLALAPSARAGYLAFPGDIRDQLAALAKPGLTAALLSPDTFAEPLPEPELRRNLAALLALSPENQALFETFAGGPAYPKLDSAPAPYDWSDAAWTRTREAFNSLSGTQRDRILALGATQGLFDYSGSFLAAALADYDATLASSRRSAILSAGWGRHFAEYFADETIRAVFLGIGDFTSAELSTINQFGISPQAFSSSSSLPSLGAQSIGTLESNYSSARDNLAHLASLPATDRALLARLGLGGGILHAYGYGYYDEQENWVYPNYAQILDNTLAFARLLSTEDIDTVRALGLGHDLVGRRAQEVIYINDGYQTASERLADVLALYRSLAPAERALVLDHGIFATSLHDQRLDVGVLDSVFTTLAALSPNTRDYLAFARDHVRLLDLLLGDDIYNNYYSLSEIDDLLSGLSAAEFATLRELRPGRSILRGDSYDGGILSASDLKSFLGFVASLSGSQRNTLNELGITRVGNERKGLFLSDHEGLGRLLQAYAELSPDLRVETRQISPYSYYDHFEGRSFFFASDDGYDHTSYNVSFASPGDLHVGATRRLYLYSDRDDVITFKVPDGHDIFLRASTLIELDGVTFANGVRAITMEAATLNLANLDFPEGSVVSLNSKLGGMGTDNKYPNFNGESIPGRVNFLYNVRYGGGAMFDEQSFRDSSRGNIVIGTLKNPAPLPNYTPPTAN